MVSIGQTVSSGQAIGTLYDWPSSNNEHLHVGVRPVQVGEDPASIGLWGAERCIGGTVDRHGYVDPIPWLAARSPRSGGSRLGNFDAHGGVDVLLRRGATWYLDLGGWDNTDRSWTWGRRTDQVYIGDFDEDGGDDVLLRRGATW